MPGLVDTHVHINEPGRTDWEGFSTATRAAAAGGVTTLIEMPLNSIPATTSRGRLSRKARSRAGQTVGGRGFLGRRGSGKLGRASRALGGGRVSGSNAFWCPAAWTEFACRHRSRSSRSVAGASGARCAPAGARRTAGSHRSGGESVRGKIASGKRIPHVAGVPSARGGK